MSSFPPPPPPPPPPPTPPAAQPTPPPPPNQSSGTTPTAAKWWNRKHLKAPLWVWLTIAIVLVGGAIGVAVSTTNSDGDTASKASTARESTDESTEPPKTSSTSDSAGTTATTETSTTSEATDVPTTAAPAPKEVLGSPVGITGDRANPVPAGTIADIGAGWRIQVLNVNTDATAAVAAENQFNELPPPGSTFTLITVALGYFGLDDPKSAFETTISAVGAANVELTANCGVIPQELNAVGDLFSGGVVVGNVCFVTTPADAASLQLYASGDLFGGDKIFLGTSPAPAAAVPMTALTGPQPGAASSPSRLAPTPLGVAADVGEGWKLAVSGVARDITDETLAENQFNDPPPDGFRFIGVDVSYSYDGAGSASGYSVTTRAVGSDNRELRADCGVTPGQIDLSADIFAGGTVSGTICFVVPSSSPALVLYAISGFAGHNVTFATA